MRHFAILFTIYFTAHDSGAAAGAHTSSFTPYAQSWPKPPFLFIAAAQRVRAAANVSMQADVANMKF